MQFGVIDKHPEFEAYWTEIRQMAPRSGARFLELGAFEKPKSARSSADRKNG